MVNSKNKKSVIALVVMALLLVTSIVLAATGAWFTAKATTPDVNANFGTIVLTADENNKVEVQRADTKVDIAMPGDTIKVNFKVTNAGQAAFYLVKLEIKVGDDAALETGYYTISAAGALEKATDTAGSVEAGAALTVNADKVLEVLTYGNTYQGKPITVSLDVRAIQQANNTAGDAYTQLTSSVDLETGLKAGA